MAVITPQTDVILLKVPLEMDETNQLTFANATAQYNYFNGLTGKLAVGTDFTYQRKDGTMRIGAQFDDLIGYNYVMYRNDAFSNKWFYAFITGMEYLNDGVTAVSIKTDVWQTWQFDLVYKRTFVEREHVNDDTVGANTIPENLELGEYVTNSYGSANIAGGGTMLYAVGVSKIIGTLSADPSNTINGLPNGLFYIFVDSISSLQSVAKMYDDAGRAEDLYTMFVFPKALLMANSTWKYQTGTWSYTGNTFSTTFDVYIPTTNTSVGQLATDIEIPLPIFVGKTYVPRNNKLKTFPYCYFNITNNSGTTVTYHYEDFDGKPKFNCDGVIDVGCSTKLYPTNYKNMTASDNSYEYGITGGKFPTVSWNSDSFTNWLTQNAVNIANEAGHIGLTTAANMAYGNVVGAASSLLSGVGNTVASVYQASLIPNQAKGNTNVGDLNFTAHQNKFTYYDLTIKPEYAKIIDDYFDMFGYKVNRVKIPNVTGRTNWNFVKTIGCYIEADIPQGDLQEIKDMFDRGVTFWHNPLTFADYSQSNAIVT